jgi:hypothetical protein
MIAPLIWLLVFDAVVCFVWWGLTSVLGVTAPERLMKLMIGLVILINAVVLVFWVLALFGVAPESLLHGPDLRRR